MNSGSNKANQGGQKSTRGRGANFAKLRGIPTAAPELPAASDASRQPKEEARSDNVQSGTKEAATSQNQHQQQTQPRGKASFWKTQKFQNQPIKQQDVQMLQEDRPQPRPGVYPTMIESTFAPLHIEHVVENDFDTVFQMPEEFAQHLYSEHPGLFARNDPQFGLMAMHDIYAYLHFTMYKKMANVAYKVDQRLDDKNVDMARGIDVNVPKLFFDIANQFGPFAMHGHEFKPADPALLAARFMFLAALGTETYADSTAIAALFRYLDYNSEADVFTLERATFGHYMGSQAEVFIEALMNRLVSIKMLDIPINLDPLWMRQVFETMSSKADFDQAWFIKFGGKGVVFNDGKINDKEFIAIASEEANKLAVTYNGLITQELHTIWAKFTTGGKSLMDPVRGTTMRAAFTKRLKLLARISDRIMNKIKMVNVSGLDALGSVSQMVYKKPLTNLEYASFGFAPFKMSALEGAIGLLLNAGVKDKEFPAAYVWTGRENLTLALSDWIRKYVVQETK